MHLEAHAGLGWAIGVLAPGSTPRLRGWCLLAGVLPDIDAVAYLFGPEAYMNWHHTFGHNIFLGLGLGLLAARAHGGLRDPGALRAGALTALAFASHLVTDMKLSAYPVCLFWPLSRAEYELPDNLALVAPINTHLVYASGVLTLLLAVLRGVTPLEQIHPRLDRIFLDFFRPKPLACDACARRTNQRCDGCGRAVCLRHGRLGRGFRITCPRCGSDNVPRGAGNQGLSESSGHRNQAAP